MIDDGTLFAKHHYHRTSAAHIERIRKELIMEYSNESNENYSVVTGESRRVGISHIAWGPIFGGSIIALGVFTLLMFLGISAGAVSFNPYAGPNVERLAVGGGIWLTVSSIIALFFGAWCTAVFAGFFTKTHGALNGLATWGVVTVTTAVLGVGAMGAVVGGGLSLLQSGSRAAGPAMQSAAMGLSQQPGVNDMAQSLSKQLAKGVRNGTIDLQAASGIIGHALQTGQLSDPDRQTLVSMLTSNSNMSQQQANKAVEGTMQSITQARLDLANAANQARRATAAAAFTFFVEVLLSGIAALGGGLVGSSYWRNRTSVRAERETQRNLRAAA
ncbi:MAG: hypothetical protein Q8932_20480 [Bacteroidota bacterium]|nr:hypothetical protein [Bacteroidota bacterium]